MQLIYSDHCRVDERSLAMHRLIARKLLADPELLNKARHNVRRWQSAEGSPLTTFREWQTILDGSVEQVAQLLVARSETATRLRQSSPFTGILSEMERQTIYESYSTRTYHPGGQPDIG